VSKDLGNSAAQKQSSHVTTMLLRIVPLLLAASVGIVVIDAGFVYDDPSALLENPVVNGAVPL